MNKPYWPSATCIGVMNMDRHKVNVSSKYDRSTVIYQIKQVKWRAVRPIFHGECVVTRNQSNYNGQTYQNKGKFKKEIITSHRKPLNCFVKRWKSGVIGFRWHVMRSRTKRVFSWPISSRKVKKPHSNPDIRIIIAPPMRQWSRFLYKSNLYNNWLEVWPIKILFCRAIEPSSIMLSV